MRYYLKPARTTVTKNKQKQETNKQKRMESIGEDVEKWEFVCM